MNLRCLQEGLQEAIAEAGLTELSDTLIGVYLFSFVGAVALGPIVLWLYQRRVEKLMATRGDGSAPSSGSQEPEPSTPGGARARALPPYSTDALLAAALEGDRAQYRMILSSVGAFAAQVGVILTVSRMITEGGDLRSLSDWLDSAFFAFALASGVCAPLVLVAVQSRRPKRLVWILFASLLVVSAIWDIGFDDTLSGVEKLEDFAYAALIIGIVYVAVGGRRLRNVVPLLTLFHCLLFAVFFAVGVVVYAFAACEIALFALIGLTLAILGAWSFYRAIFALMGALTRAYERRSFSETQFQFVLWSMNVVLLFVLAVGPETDAVADLDRWAAAIGIALLIAMAVYRRHLKRLTPFRPPRSLLLLRVFSKSRRTQRLLDDLSYRWSFIGPIYLVGGPDLAKAYLEPHELLLFLRRRAKELFVLDREALRRRLDHLEDPPDPDRRYRVQEFFCLADVWQEAVDVLVDESDVVLLDLRGFDSARQGAAFEVMLLARKNALDKTLFLVDGKTDLAAVVRALAEVPGAEMREDRVYRVEPSTDSMDVLRALLER